MLKPFPFRVKATLAFMEELINWTSLNKSSIENARNLAIDFKMNLTFKIQLY